MNFGEKLQMLRKEKGWSQEGLAENIGVSRQAVAKWELGQCYPDIDKLIAISDLFKINIDKLVKDNNDPCSMQEKNIEKNIIDSDILDFLCKAKKSTYAAKGAEISPSRPNSHDLQYSEGNLLYIDTYLGREKFAGEEALWKDGIPYWSMNYVGRIVTEGFSGDFLKEVLLLVSKEKPYRGPMVYENGQYKYHCIVSGEFNWFHGYEEIYYNDVKVYECMFHGGSIR